MNIIIIILAGLGLFVGGLVMTFIQIKCSVTDKNTKKWKKIDSLVIVASAALLLFGCSFKIIPTGYTGVKTTLGQISEDTITQGFNFKIPFIQSIHLVNNKQQDVTVDAQVWGETTEKTPVYASDTVITYQIKSDKSTWIFRNVTDTDMLMTDSIVSSAIKSSMVELNVNDVTNRAKIEPLVKDKLNVSLSEKYGDAITVLKVVINQMDFEDSYNEAISAKNIAQQVQQRQAIENDTAIAKAEADKKVAITKAEAEAEAKKIAADAEAEANEKIKSSLNDDIMKSKFYDKWNGELPKAMGSDTVITDIADSKAKE